MTRKGIPIENYALSDPVQVGIRTSQKFTEWQALVEANAGPDEIVKWELGEYPRWFKVRLMAWYTRRVEFDSHREDAISREMKSRRK